MTIAAECLSNDSGTVSCPPSPSFRLTSAILYGQDTQNSTKEAVTSFLRASLANPSPSLAASSAASTNEICGPPPSNASAWYDRATHSWRMSQGWLLADISEKSWADWPRAGMTRAGEFYPLPNWERRISETGFGLLPTPVVPNGGRRHNLDRITLTGNTLYREDGSKAQLDLETYVRLYPTPRAHDAKSGDCPSERKRKSPGLETTILMEQEKFATPQSRDFRVGQRYRWESQERSRNLNDQLGGKLNPNWIDWLMGWPIGWTDLNPLAMDRFRRWRHAHGCF